MRSFPSFPSRAFPWLLSLLLTALLPRASAAESGQWISLFDGVSLAGWKASENPASFRVVDGTIYTDGPRAHLFYVGREGPPATFENFEFSAEVMTKPNANSGIYFHTSWLETGWPIHQGFEVQLDNSQPLQGNYIENKRTGSLYGIRNVYPKLVHDNEWFTVSITVRKPRVEIRINGTLVVDYLEPKQPFPSGAPKFNLLGRGTFALQAHDAESHAAFRNLRVRELPSTPVAGVESPELDSETATLLPLAKDNFPVVDLNTVISLSALERALTQSRVTGLGLGIVASREPDPQNPRATSAAAARLSLPANDEASARAFLNATKSLPIFRVLSPSDRNWIKAITPQTRASFDCIIADAASFTPDASGPDAQAFMEKLVAETVSILSAEPVDIYASPTLLPIELVSRAEELWTEERMKKIIDAAVSHGVAIEINTVRVLPSERFIRLAKAAGAKFSIGSGRSYAEVFDRAYAWETQKKIPLRWQDMYVPGHGPTRAQRELSAQP